MVKRAAACVLASAVALPLYAQSPAAAPAVGPKVTVIKAGQLIDPETGTTAPNQLIVVEGEKIAAVGANLAIPPGAEVIDLSQMSVMPGLVDAHTHMALTYKEIPEHNIYYYTYIQESTPLRAIQAASNGMQMLASGFTVVRDVGNNALYADTALRMAIEQGWLPGPTVIPSGPMIGSTGGQYWPTPEMYRDHNIMYPEYIDADTPDEIVKAIRQNLLFGAKTIKLCVDCKPWGYSVEDMQLAVREAAKGNAKVEGHCQTTEGVQRAIDAGIYIIAHGRAPTSDQHAQMGRKGIFLASTDTPFTGYHGTEQAFTATVAQLKSAYQNGAPLTFSTDMDYWNDRMKRPDGSWMSRGDLTIDFLRTWKAAGVPNRDILKAITINGYKAADIIAERGPIEPGLYADIIAVPGNPLDDIDALRTVQFVMKNGLVYKRDGRIAPEPFLNPGPVKGWNRR